MKLCASVSVAVPRARVGWAHELGDRGVTSINSLAGGGGAFAVQSNRLDRDRLLAGFDLSVAVADSLRLFGNYAVETGKHGDSNAVTAGLLYSW